MNIKEKIVTNIAKMLNVSINKENDKKPDALQIIRNNQEHIKKLMELVDKKVINTFQYSSKIDNDPKEITLAHLAFKIDKLTSTINEFKRAMIPQQYKAIETEDHRNSKLDLKRQERRYQDQDKKKQYDVKPKERSFNGSISSNELKQRTIAEAGNHMTYIT